MTKSPCRKAMAWLALRTNDGRDAISRTDLTQFTFRGERIALIDQGRGIRKPRSCRAALSIMTVHTPHGRERPYEDFQGPDGLPRYKMRADRRGESDNRAVRAAMDFQLPVIWLWGVATGWYQPVFPVYVIDVEPEHGIAAVRNGLALCKIHHAAYDAGILGISPDYRVAIRHDVLHEVDGPLLEHGIKALHGHGLLVMPVRRADRPDPELLEACFERFLSA